MNFVTVTDVPVFLVYVPVYVHHGEPLGHFAGPSEGILGAHATRCVDE